MQSGADKKEYFLRQKNRITGPFAMLKLTAMYRSGLLSCEDMYSADKSDWHHIGDLFPELAPRTVAPAMSSASVPETRARTVSPLRSRTVVSGTAVGGSETVSGSSPAGEPVAEAKKKSFSFQEWIIDIGRTFALLWNFQEMLKKHAGKSQRFYGISIAVHVILGTAFVLMFGKYYSRFSHVLLLLLKGIGLIAVLGTLASLLGVFAAKYCTPKGKKIIPSWKICAAGIFMNYGTLGCCALALAHGVPRYLWVQLLMFLIYSAVLCSSTMQLRDYLEENSKEWKILIICTVLLLNPVTAALTYCFTILI